MVALFTDIFQQSNTNICFSTFLFTEWDSDWQGPPVIVEVLETSSTDLSQNGIVNGTTIQGKLTT